MARSAGIKKTLSCLAGVIAVAGSAIAGGWPFIVVRTNVLPGWFSDRQMDLVEVNARFPGSCDEYWFVGGIGISPGAIEKEMAVSPAFRKACDAAGIAIGFEQGGNLGHGECGAVFAKDVEATLPDEVWAWNADGRKTHFLCPRSPYVRALEEKRAEAFCRTTRPVSYWVDDDVRLGVGSRTYCFCDRCVADFNARQGTKLDRATLVGRIMGGAKKDPLRREWLRFAADSIALYAEAARRGVEKVDPTIRMGLETCRANWIGSGVNYLPTLRALSGPEGRPVGIRAGAGWYYEDLDLIQFKIFSVAREAERSRWAGPWVGSITYEQENYRRQILHKSPEAMMIESTFALAAGCDSLTEYFVTIDTDEPKSFHAECAEETAAWRPYLKRLSDVSRKTHLGGVARFVGSEADMLLRRNLDSTNDTAIALIGIPVAPMEAGGKCRYVDDLSMDELSVEDCATLAREGAVVDASVAQSLKRLGGAAVEAAFAAGRLTTFDLSTLARRGASMPWASEREAFLDALDRVEPLPVRMERVHRFGIYPRVLDGSRRVLAVTVFNLSIGHSFPSRLRIRKPAGRTALWARPKQEDVELAVERGAHDDEIVVTLPELPGWQPGTLFLK